MNSFLELHDSYELYEFTRQYYLDIDPAEIKDIRFPVSVYFDDFTGKPTFQSAPHNTKKLKIRLENNGDVYFFESNDVEELIKFVREKSVRKLAAGDKVEIVDNKYVDIDNINFFRENFIDYEWACRYDYNNLPNDTKDNFYIVVVCGSYALIHNITTDKCYIVEIVGLKLINKGA